MCENYTLVSKLFIICEKRGLRLMLENPQASPHPLNTYWCLKPKILDNDRRLLGDYFKKPTQYWFLNFEPYHNLVFTNADNAIKCKNPIRMMNKDDFKHVGNMSKKTMRSMISQDYARNFIKSYLVQKDEGEEPCEGYLF